MPGLVIFKRRWAVGSDDLVVPATILFTIHFIWYEILKWTTILDIKWKLNSISFAFLFNFLSIVLNWRLFILSIVSVIVDYQKADCMTDLFEHTLGYIIILIGCVIVEGFIAYISMRGSILNTTPRSSMKYLLYIRIGNYLTIK